MGQNGPGAADACFGRGVHQAEGTSVFIDAGGKSFRAASFLEQKGVGACMVLEGKKLAQRGVKRDFGGGVGLVGEGRAESAAHVIGY